MSKISVDELSEYLAGALQDYCQEITDSIKQNVDTVADETNEVIKKHITFKQHTGDYIKAFRVKTTFEDRYNKRKTWFVTNGQYRLTHLLENGHALRQGGRTDSYEHIKYGEEFAQIRMEELAKEAIENAGH